MREILFRGKNADNGEWVYGSYFAHQKIRLCIVRDESEVEENTQHLIVQDALACDWGFENGMQVVDVLPETVGQYTGLTDKNGKKIFEGDIVKETSMHFSTGKIETDIFAVEWNEFDFSFRLIHRLIHGEHTTWLTKFGAYEVIGNIHYNPELLEEKKE